MGVLGIGVPLSPAPAFEQGSCSLHGFRGVARLPGGQLEEPRGGGLWPGPGAEGRRPGLVWICVLGLWGAESSLPVQSISPGKSSLE